MPQQLERFSFRQRAVSSRGITILLGTTRDASVRLALVAIPVGLAMLVFLSPAYAQPKSDWAGFRGPGGRGIVEGFPIRSSWNADAEAGAIEGVAWQREVPGLGHSSPVIFGDRLFLLTAIADAGAVELNIAAGGKPTAADDNGVQSWVLLCYDKKNGEELWRKTIRRGVPRATRHSKATHANTSVCVDNNRVVAFLGSEGLYCYDLEGELLWSRDLGVINVSKYDIGWGYASSPALHSDRIVLVCDAPDNPFLAAFRANDGEELWRVSRKGDCERSWGTPLIHASEMRTQVVVNGWPWVVSYQLEDGAELWRVKGGGDNPIPTPFEVGGLVYVTNAHGGKSPILAVHQSAEGNLSEADGDTGDAVVWSTERGGSYMSTPVVYHDYMYLGGSNGIISCFHATTGAEIYQHRLGEGAGVIASLVATDGKVFCASENGRVYVLEAGPEFKLVANNAMGEPCLATPAISEGVLYIRTASRLIAIQ